MSGKHAFGDDSIDRAWDKHLVEKVNDPDDWMEPLRDHAWSDDKEEQLEERLLSTFISRHIISRLTKINTSLRGRRDQNE